MERVIEDEKGSEIWPGVLVKQEAYLIAADSSRYLTVFVPFFPVQVLKLLDTYAAREQSRTADSAWLQPMREARVLVVDDNRLNLDIVESLLEPYQMEVECVMSGKEAIQAVMSKDYDLVFMDHMMPDMDGIETLRRIRSLPEEKYRTLPVVALTANALDGAREMFLEHGFHEFLAKPIDMEMLDKVLKRWLKRKCLPIEIQVKSGIMEG